MAEKTEKIEEKNLSHEETNAATDDIILKVEHLTKLYGLNKAEAGQMMQSGATKDAVFKKTGVTAALWDVSLEVKRGEIFVIIGLSGSGKSTLVRCFNRLLKPTAGHIIVNGKSVDSMNGKELLDFRRNDISMVFQNFGLMSHRTVLENVAYGLEVKGVPKDAREQKAREMTSMVGLSGLEDKPITSLSGGMRQRVGIARALANDPKVLLMDEPFSALDPLVRRDMQFELLSIQSKLGQTVIFITHDINEAFKLGDTVAIMRDGRLIQVDSPEGMSTNPADDYVREFINSADKTKVLSAKHIMVTPSCLVHKKESPYNAVREMKANDVSTAYVINDKMELDGILTIDDALRAGKENLRLGSVITRGSIETVHEDTLISDIIPIAIQTKYPIAVIDEENRLKGIVSKASVLSSML